MKRPLVLLLLAGAVAAAPAQHVFGANGTLTDEDPDGGSSPERRAEMAALLDKYAPVFKLASTESYFPSSVQYMLDRYGYVAYQGNGGTYRPDRRLLTTERLADLPDRGLGQALSVDEEHNGQPLMPPGGEFMYGPAGQGRLEVGDDGRGRVSEEVYGFWVDRGRGVVDLIYWTFYPYNLGKLVGTLGYLGNHVTDWERLRMRTVNGQAVSADFNTHSGGPFSAGTYRWEDVERTADDRPIAYVASGSHGVWPDAGRHVYAQLLNLWALVDMTDDRGPLWDTRGRVVPIEYWTGPAEARKLKHTGDQRWLDFGGKYGNYEREDCWWHFFVGICQLIDGPTGPNRDFSDPPDCIVAPAQKGDESHYSFFLTRAVVAQARSLGITDIVIEQVCARPSASATAFSDDLAASELEIWPLQASIPFDPHEETEYRANVPGCAGDHSAAKAYRLAMYNGTERVSTSPMRTLCLFTEGRRGWVHAGAADVRDLDEWRWDLLIPADVALVPQRKIKV